MRILITLFLLFSSFLIECQTVTSPYSILGIGDIDTKDYGKYFGMGSTSLALRSATYLNLSNPASLSALDYKVVNFDLNFRGRTSRFQMPDEDTFTSASKDVAIRRISLSFKTTPQWGFSFGLKPYSTVNYQLEENNSLSDTDDFFKAVDGSGGLNQVYFANGYQINKHFSIGLTTSFLFGSLFRETTYFSEDLLLNIQKNEHDIIHGFQFEGGIQYFGKINERLTQQIGLTLTNSVKPFRQLSTEYKEGDQIIKKEVVDGNGINLPLHIGLGYALIIKNKFTISTDYNYYDWEKQKVAFPDSYINKSQRISLGFQYSKMENIQNTQRELFFLQAGLSYENNYINIKNRLLNNFSYSLGAGFRVTNQFSINTGLEFGNRGRTDWGQIKEKYSQYVLGISLREIWFGNRKFGRYN